MSCTTIAVNRDTAPPPPSWTSILAPFASPTPFPTTCGCTVWRHEIGASDAYYVGHEPDICHFGRADADVQNHLADVVAVPRHLLASATWNTHVDTVYDRVRAASSRHRNGGECLRLSTINVQPPPIFDVAENNGLPERFECLTCDGFGVMPADGAVCRSCDGAGAK